MIKLLVFLYTNHPKIQRIIFFLYYSKVIFKIQNDIKTQNYCLEKSILKMCENINTAKQFEKQ